MPLDRKIESLSDRFAVYFISLKNLDLAEYVLTSLKFYENRSYEYVQLIFPDLNGNFPNEVGYDYDQKILGNFK